eukprot:5906819-Ditylum_brightwellii.AAC.1
MQCCQHYHKNGQDICPPMIVGPIWAVGDSNKPLVRSEVLEFLSWHVVPWINSMLEGKGPEFHVDGIWPSSMCIQ